jgi:hypothetical protein
VIVGAATPDERDAAVERATALHTTATVTPEPS